MHSVPERLVQATALVGRLGELRDRVAALAAAGVTTLLVSPLAATRAGRRHAPPSAARWRPPRQPGSFGRRGTERG